VNTRQSKTKRWSAEVTQHSHALDLEEGIFTWDDPKKIAQSLKESALKSKNLKGTPYQSAMSMLNFYINRAGKNLSSEHKAILTKAKAELRMLFNG
jgi:hypothetical protein